MGNIYVAINGDDVGTRIGEAIANDDHEGLASASSAIKGAHDGIDQWVESVGGKKITASGDEGLYIIPEEHAADLEQIKDRYSEGSGHGLTIGVGSSMSEASKALIYGKLNGKNQIVHYEPGIEDSLSDQEGQEESAEGDVQGGMPKPGQLQAQADADEDQSEGVEPGPADDSIEEDESPEDSTPSDEAEMEVEPTDEEDGKGEGEEDQDQSQPIDEDDSDPDPDTQEPPPKKAKSKGNQYDPSKDPDAPGIQAIDGKIDGKDFGADHEDDDSEDQDQPEQDEDSETPTAQEDSEPDSDDQEDQDQLPSEGSGVKGDSAYQDLNGEDASQPDEDSGEDVEADLPDQDEEQQPQQDEYNHDDAMADMIHGDMTQDQGDGDQAPGEGEEGGEDSSLDEELRQDIASALMGFKENKDMLEQAREQNPKLYQATITMLRSMIEMAKKLGFGPEQDMQDMENQQNLQEEFPGADEDQEPGQEDSENPVQANQKPGAPTPAKK